MKNTARSNYISPSLPMIVTESSEEVPYGRK